MSPKDGKDDTPDGAGKAKKAGTRAAAARPQRKSGKPRNPKSDTGGDAGAKRAPAKPTPKKTAPEKTAPEKTAPAKPAQGPPAPKREPTAAARAEQPVRLPSSGLAEEILQGLEPATAAPSSEPDRVYRFADEVGAFVHYDEEPEERPETWVSFGLGEETFAFPVAHVLEVTRVETLTRIPHAPFPVRGISTLRGQILPVVDLRRRLDLGDTELTPESRILVVSSRGRTLGLLVDRVRQVVHLLRSRIEPTPEDVMTEQSDYLLGVYDLDPGFVILLDLEAVMMVRHSPHPEIEGFEAAESGGPE